MLKKYLSTKFIAVFAVIALILFFAINIFRYYIPLDKKQPDLSIIGNIEYADGLARQGIDLFLMMSKIKDISVTVIPTSIKMKDLPPELLQAINKKTSQYGKVVIYEKMLSLSFSRKNNDFWRRLAGHKPSIWIAYSMYETTQIPDSFVRNINNYFDAVVVPDKFLVPIYKNSGVTKPIFTIPLSVDMDYLLEREIKSKRNQVFTFMTLGSMTKRKNILLILKAFHKKFGNRDDVRLIVNARYSIDEYKKLVLDYINEHKIRNVFVKLKKLDKQEYADMLSKADCYINMSSGEGFSVQPREAMALGIPVIVSNNTAHETLVESKLVEPVKSDKLIDSYLGGKYYDVDPNDIGDAMEKVFTQYSDYLKDSKKRREWIKRYHPDNIKYLYYNLIKPKKIILGDENKIDGDTLITNSKDLYNKYNKIVMTKN